MLELPLFPCWVAMHFAMLMWCDLDFFYEFFCFDSVDVDGFPCLAGTVLVNLV